MTGRTVLQYQLGEKLGAGGSGEVYKALDTRLNRFVAIKVLSAGTSADPESRRRFIHEAQAASALNHPNIITIYDVIDDGDTQYMVMEYVAGKTLFQLIFNDGRQSGLPVPDVIRYAIQMADALGAAHAAGIIHRDLKPANVMVTASGLVKLLDFGLAKLMEWPAGENTATMIYDPLTVAGVIMGTVNYMSPEQAAAGKLDARSDIFSFGSVLYEMLTGQCAFRGTSVIATLSAVLRDDIQPIMALTTGVPSELERIVVRCLQKDPDQRFQSMPELNAALKRLADFDAVSSPPTVRTIVPSPAPSRGSKPTLVIGILVVLLAIAGGAGYWWNTRRVSAPRSAQTGQQAPATSAQSSDGILTNDSIIEMMGAKVAPLVIVSQIRASKTNFNLSAPEVIRLSKAGVPAEVIEAMRNPDAKPPAPPAPVPVILVDGLPVRLTLTEDIPGDAVQGEALHFKVARDLRVDGSVVVPQGAEATGSIADGAKKKILGIGGKMTFSLEKIDTADGRKLSIRATPARAHDGSSKRPVNTSAPKPKGVAASTGTEYVGYIDGPQTVMISK